MKTRRNQNIVAGLALAVAAASCTGDAATGPHDGFQDPPELAGPIPAQSLLIGGTATVPLSPWFTYPHGADLRYSARSSDPAVATVAVVEERAIVSPVAPGAATITVTAANPTGLRAESDFGVVVAGPASAAGTDGVDPVIRFGTVGVATPEGGLIAARFEARPPPTVAIEVAYSIGADADSATIDADETDHDGGSGGTVRFEAGSGSVILPLAIQDDEDIEHTREVLVLSLDEPGDSAGYNLESSTEFVVTIEEGVCDRSPPVRTALMDLAQSERCQDADASHLAAIETLDLRGPPPSSDFAPSVFPTAGSWTEYCRMARGPQAHSTVGRPVATPPSLNFAACARAAGAPAPSLLPARSSAGQTVSEPLDRLRAGDFLELSGLRELWLFDNELTELPAGIFAGLTELHRVILDANRLAELPEGLLAGLPKLEIFAVADNELTELPPDLFADLPRIRNVWLYGNHLTELPPELFHASAGTLEGIFLDGNELEALPADLFADLRRLEYLQLSGNRLANPEPGVFSELDNLKELTLGQNGIAALPSGLFAGLDKLESLVLDGNLLTSLPSDAFAGLGSLRALWAAGNQLTSLPAGLFSGPDNLAFIFLQANELDNLPADVFSDLSGLQFLALNLNKLDNLPPDLFSGLASLRYLYLDDNEISSLSPDLFSGLASLEVMSLDNNRVAEIPEGTFTDLPALQHLGLVSASVTELKPGDFEELSDLKALWLNGGTLRTIRPGAFRGLDKLESLYLHENHMIALDPGAFSGLPALRELWLYNNQLGDVAEGALAGLPELRRLVLWGNRLATLRPGAFAELTELEELYASGNEIASLPPSVFSGLARLSTLFLAENRLAELPDGIFAGLSELTYLHLGHNPGAPFPVRVRMERTDTTELNAPGPAELTLTVAEGAPFAMTIPLAVSGGTLSVDSAVVPVGQSRSAALAVTASPGQGATQVVVGPAPPVPESLAGIVAVAADTLVLFGSSGDVADADPEAAATDASAPLSMRLSGRLLPPQQRWRRQRP